MCKSLRKWKQLKIKSRFYSHIYNKLRNFATVIPLSLRELVFYSTNLSLPIFLFTREVVVSPFYYISRHYNTQEALFAQHLSLFCNFTFLHRERVVLAMRRGFSCFRPEKSFSFNEKKVAFSFSFWPYFPIFASEILLLWRNRSNHCRAGIIYKWDQRCTEMNRRKPDHCRKGQGRFTGKCQPVFLCYRDFRIRLLALSTTDVSSEAR